MTLNIVTLRITPKVLSLIAEMTNSKGLGERSGGSHRSACPSYNNTHVQSVCTSTRPSIERLSEIEATGYR